MGFLQMFVYNDFEQTIISEDKKWKAGNIEEIVFFKKKEYKLR